ncbi:hypothetical protein BEL01nite_79140 [Bradyrhizobium elkanii]|nr:hypothetical protein BEL01nite_79140 [Bradyrhizobium elkanii]
MEAADGRDQLSLTLSRDQEGVGRAQRFCASAGRGVACAAKTGRNTMACLSGPPKVVLTGNIGKFSKGL